MLRIESDSPNPIAWDHSFKGRERNWCCVRKVIFRGIEDSKSRGSGKDGWWAAVSEIGSLKNTPPSRHPTFKFLVRLSKEKYFPAKTLAPIQIAASMKFRTEISDLDDGCLGNIFTMLEPNHR